MTVNGGNGCHFIHTCILNYMMFHLCLWQSYSKECFCLPLGHPWNNWQLYWYRFQLWFVLVGLEIAPAHIKIGGWNRTNRVIYTGRIGNRTRFLSVPRHIYKPYRVTEINTVPWICGPHSAPKTQQTFQCHEVNWGLLGTRQLVSVCTTDCICHFWCATVVQVLLFSQVHQFHRMWVSVPRKSNAFRSRPTSLLSWFWVRLLTGITTTVTLLLSKDPISKSDMERGRRLKSISFIKASWENINSLFCLCHTSKPFFLPISSFVSWNAELLFFRDSHGTALQHK